ncbi:MAG: Zn-ribbon domain-containing OB-fold protein [Actinomycetota bacterium]|nr:Zn-ribbon domain-containing OB-fold protein [Actinomycetota bacterium]
MGTIEPQLAEVIVPVDFPYNYRIGQYLEKYIKGLSEKKIMATKCPKCGGVFVPPRKVCGNCNVIMKEWVEVGPGGTVENYALGHVRVVNGLVEKTDPVEIFALVKLDGATALLASKLLGVKPKDVKKGMRVKTVFKEPPEDNFGDLIGFEST